MIFYLMKIVCQAQLSECSAYFMENIYLEVSMDLFSLIIQNCINSQPVINVLVHIYVCHRVT